MVHHLAGKAINTTKYGLRRSVRIGEAEEDPELSFFGSYREKRDEGICKAYPYA